MRKITECPICNSKAIDYVFTGRTTRNPRDSNVWKFFRCSQCDHGFLNPQPQWDELGDYYDAHYSEYDQSRGLEQDIESTIKAAREVGEYRHVKIHSGMRILDVGCGGGSFLHVARGLGAQVKGVEPSPVASERCRQSGLDVFTGSLEQFVAEYAGDTKFDLITFNHVLEHVPIPSDTLKCAKRILEPTGTIWVAVPNGACRFARRLGWRWYSTDLPFHLMHFSAKSLELTAQRAGLAITRIYTDTMPSAVRDSITVGYRHFLKIPKRFSKFLISDQYATKYAKRLDEKKEGEAILCEFNIPEGSAEK